MLLTIKNLTKRYSLNKKDFLFALDNVNLTLEEQEIMAIVGESGSGKSTLAKVICGLEEKDAGEIYFQGEKMPDKFSSKDFLAYSSKIQMVFQNPYSSLNPRMTIFDILQEGLLIQGKKNKQEIKNKVYAMLEKVGLDKEHAMRYAHEFSGGQKQRISLARALIMQPKLLICDEALSALDVSIQAQIVNLLKQLKQEMKFSILFIAHDLSMVEYLADKICVMYLGEIVESTTSSIIKTCQHPYTKSLVSSILNPQEKISLDLQTIKEPILNQGQNHCLFVNRCSYKEEKCYKVRPLKENKGKSCLL